eukprot:scaffold246151_cov24-Prasinocladus_malaysianus.AAC.1
MNARINRLTSSTLSLADIVSGIKRHKVMGLSPHKHLLGEAASIMGLISQTIPDGCKPNTASNSLGRQAACLVATYVQIKTAELHCKVRIHHAMYRVCVTTRPYE